MNIEYLRNAVVFIVVTVYGARRTGHGIRRTAQGVMFMAKGVRY